MVSPLAKPNICACGCDSRGAGQIALHGWVLDGVAVDVEGAASSSCLTLQGSCEVDILVSLRRFEPSPQVGLSGVRSGFVEGSTRCAFVGMELWMTRSSLCSILELKTWTRIR